MHSGPVTVTLWTSNFCGACTATRHVVARVADVLGDRVRVVERNVADGPGEAARAGITATPTVVIGLDGQEVRRATGTPTVDQLFATIASVITR